MKALFSHVINRYYYQVKLDEENKVNSDLISEYFEANRTVLRVLDIFSELHGIRFDRIEGADADQLSDTGKGADLLLHPDQQLYAVWNSVEGQSKSSSFVGYLYIDLYARVSAYVTRSISRPSS